MEFSDNDVWKTREIPVEQTPAFMVLPVLERPDAILRKMPHNRGMITGFWHGKPEPVAWNELREAHGGMPMRTGSIKLDEIRFVLFLAKIAHGFAMVHRDRFENFIPLLPELILRKPSRFPMAYLIGGETEQEEATAATHSMELLHVAADIGELLAVRIRLFVHWGAPTYQVVAAASPLAYHRMCEFTEAK